MRVEQRKPRKNKTRSRGSKTKNWSNFVKIKHALVRVKQKIVLPPRERVLKNRTSLRKWFNSGRRVTPPVTPPHIYFWYHFRFKFLRRKIIELRGQKKEAKSPIILPKVVGASDLTTGLVFLVYF